MVNYVRGINGLLVDVNGLVAAGPSDFLFATSNGVDPFVPSSATATVTVLPGQGTGGSSRVKIEFPDNTFRNTWLRVTVLANSNTTLPANDVFYFGSAVGEMNVGNITGALRTNASDTANVRQNQMPNQNSVGVTNVQDLNKDGRVNASDTANVRQNQSPTGSITFFTAPTNLEFSLSVDEQSSNAPLINEIDDGKNSVESLSTVGRVSIASTGNESSINVATTPRNTASKAYETGNASTQATTTGQSDRSLHEAVDAFFRSIA